MSRLGVDGPATSILLRPGGALRGVAECPGDKSISHRALILGALSPGSQRVTGLSGGGDVLATTAILRSMGADITADEGVVILGEAPLGEPPDVLDCGNAGTTMRLMLGLLAGRPGLSVLTGDSSLRRRPMARVVEPLRRMGAQVDGRHGGRLAPLVVRGGGLRGIEHRSAVASAQVKSCLMLASLGATGELRIDEPHRSRDHSERMLAACGVQLHVDGTSVSMACGQALVAPDHLVVPRDLSAAAFFAVAAAICEGSELRLPDVGVNPTRTGLLDALEQVGVPLDCGPAKVSWGEPRSDWTVRSGALRPLRIGGAVVPRLIDEIPVLAVLAARCPGVSRFEDVGDLRAKESDRITTTAAMLRAFGVRVEVRDDGFDVHGRPEGPLTGGGVVDACGDHRIAMAAAVAALVADGPTTLQGAGAADTSFPGYFPLLDRCLGRVEDAGSKT